MDRLFPIALLAFVCLGLPDGVLGVAWPSMRHTFDLPLSQLGALLTAATTGYLLSSAGSGPMLTRLGIGRLLLASSAVMVVSLASYALAPSWPVVIVGGLLAGLGGGAIDAGVNVFAASSCSPRRTAWLHACYGIGAMLGPVLMTAVLTTGGSWRWGYALVAAAVAAMAVVFATTVDRWPRAAPADAPSAAAPGLGAALRQPRVLLHVALFFLYTGLEITAAQWTYTLFTEGRGVPPAVAGLWASGYWASLTVGRVAIAAMARSAATDITLRTSLALAPVAALVIWLGDSRVAAPVGVIALGFALAPVYPLLVAATPRRLGAAYATHAIGVQVAAAYLGAATVPGIAGVLARDFGLEVVGPVLTGTALGVLALHELVLRHGSPGAAAASMPRASVSNR